MRRTQPTDAVGVLLLLACSQPALSSILAGTMTGPRAYLWLAAFAVFGTVMLARIH